MFRYRLSGFAEFVAHASGAGLAFDFAAARLPSDPWFETWTVEYDGLGCRCRYVRLGTLEICYDAPKVGRALAALRREKAAARRNYGRGRRWRSAARRRKPRR